MRRLISSFGFMPGFGPAREAVRVCNIQPAKPRPVGEFARIIAVGGSLCAFTSVALAQSQNAVRDANSGHVRSLGAGHDDSVAIEYRAVAERFKLYEAEARRRSADPSIQPSYDEIASVAKTMTAQELSNEKEPRRRFKIAADTFLGFYKLNTVSRPKFCRKLGVDLSPYSNAFAFAHKVEFAKSMSIERYRQGEEEQVNVVLLPATDRFVEIEMLDISKRLNISPREFCTLINEAKDSLVASTHITKSNPPVAQVLGTIP